MEVGAGQAGRLAMAEVATIAEEMAETGSEVASQMDAKAASIASTMVGLVSEISVSYHACRESQEVDVAIGETAMVQSPGSPSTGVVVESLEVTTIGLGHANVTTMAADVAANEISVEESGRRVGIKA